MHLRQAIPASRHPTSQTAPNSFKRAAGADVLSPLEIAARPAARYVPCLEIMEPQFDAEIARLERRSRITFLIFITGWMVACAAILVAMFRHAPF
jgi:hypothetical protein